MKREVAFREVQPAAIRGPVIVPTGFFCVVCGLDGWWPHAEAAAGGLLVADAEAVIALESVRFQMAMTRTWWLWAVMTQPGVAEVCCPRAWQKVEKGGGTK